MKNKFNKITKSFVYAAIMVCALSATNYAQTVTSFNITEKMVSDAQQAWGQALVKISDTYAAGGDYTKVASDVLDTAYNYEYGIVLFKPTLTTGEQTFRMDKEGALAYFVGGNPKYKDDSGFALKGWKRYEIKTKGIIINGNMALSMGNVHLWDKDGKETIVDKTWGYRMDGKGNLRIILHHSSLPYKPTK
jgi:hypothetical protein